MSGGGPRLGTHAACRRVQRRSRSHRGWSWRSRLRCPVHLRGKCDGACRCHGLRPLGSHERLAELWGWYGTAEPTGRCIGPDREARCDGGCSAQSVIAAPKDLVAVLLQLHAARLRVEPLEPLLTELAVGYPPAPAIRLSAQEILEDPGLAGHQAVAVIGDWNCHAEGRVEVHGLARNRLLQPLVAEIHGLGECRPAGDNAHCGQDQTTHQQKTPVIPSAQAFHRLRKRLDCGPIRAVCHKQGDLRTVPPN